MAKDQALKKHLNNDACIITTLKLFRWTKTGEIDVLTRCISCICRMTVKIPQFASHEIKISVPSVIHPVFTFIDVLITCDKDGMLFHSTDFPLDRSLDYWRTSNWESGAAVTNNVTLGHAWADKRTESRLILVVFLNFFFYISFSKGNYLLNPSNFCFSSCSHVIINLFPHPTPNK